MWEEIEGKIYLCSPDGTLKIADIQKCTVKIDSNFLWFYSVNLVTYEIRVCVHACVSIKNTRQMELR